MKKSDLILSIHKKHPYLEKKQITQIIELVFAEISNGLKQEKRIEIRGFGAFSTRKRKVQEKFPTNSQDKIILKNKKVVYFRLGKEFFDRLNYEK